MIALADAGELSFCEAHIRSAHEDAWCAEFLDTLASCGIAVYLHATALHLLSSQNPDFAEVRTQIKTLEIAPSVLSVHLASGYFSTSNGEAFTRPPYTKSLVRRAVDGIHRLEDIASCKVAVENVAIYGAYPADEIDEIAFLENLSERAPGSVVFDVSNFIANRRNHPVVRHLAARLDEAPTYYHVSGGIWLDNVYFDTHAHALDDELLAEAARLVATHPAPLLYERDGRLSEVREITRDLERLKAGAYNQFGSTT